MDKELNNLIKRAKTDGLAFTKPSTKHKILTQKTNLLVFTNRRTKESVVIDKNTIRKLLDKPFL